MKKLFKIQIDNKWFLFMGILSLYGMLSIFVGSNFFLSVTDWQAEQFLSRNEQLFHEKTSYWSTVNLQSEHSQRNIDLLDYQEGDVIGTVSIPDIEVESFLLEGVNLDILRKGIARYSESVLPGEEGNFAITAHRSSFGSLFENADKLEQGDEIIIGLPTGGNVTYQVTDSFIVQPSDTWVLNNREGSTLTLITCDPVDSTEERLIVYADLVDSPENEVTFIRNTQNNTINTVSSNLLGSNETVNLNFVFIFVLINAICGIAAVYSMVFRKSMKVKSFLVILALIFPFSYGILV